jgi:hypothetical protein
MSDSRDGGWEKAECFSNHKMMWDQAQGPPNGFYECLVLRLDLSNVYFGVHTLAVYNSENRLLTALRLCFPWKFDVLDVEKQNGHLSLEDIACFPFPYSNKDLKF